MIIYNIPTDLEDKEIKELIYEQNFIENMTKQEFEEEFKLKFRTGPRDKKMVHHVVEVGPKTRKLLIQKKKVYVAFSSADIKDYIVVARCMKCQDLGHIAKYCTQKEICSHCGKEDHKKVECPKKDLPAACIPCMKRGKKCLGKECQTLKIMTERLILKTDYA